jgi:hypothetical protein
VHWLERHRGRLDNKYFASKFYLLAVVLPWTISNQAAAGTHDRTSFTIPEERQTQ